MINSLGWIGSILLASCGLPLAIQSIREGKSDLSWYFILMWGIGELFVLIYVIPQRDYPLIFNYAGNLILILIIVRYRLYPRKSPI